VVGRAEAHTALIAQGAIRCGFVAECSKKPTKLQINIDKCKKNAIFFKKNAKKFAYFNFLLYLCTRLRKKSSSKARIL
jgi:hypothetical protein